MNALSQDMVAVDSGIENPSDRQYLSFRLGQELFALSIDQVREIISYHGVNPVPLMPRFLRGVINLRGQVVPVIDLAVRLERSPEPVSKRSCIVILDVTHGDRHSRIGLVVDSVSEVLDIPQACLEPAPKFGSSVRHDFIEAVGTLNERFLVVLAAAAIVDLNELATLAQTLPSAPINQSEDANDCEPAIGAAR